jgi:hypothetical protein
MKSKTILKKSLAMLAVSAALGIASTTVSAATFPDFTVTEGNPASTPGSAPNSFTADKIVGGYTEIITFNPGGTFNVSLLWQGGQYFTNDGNEAVSFPGPFTQLNTLPPAGYGLYALFQGTGTVDTTGGTTTFTTVPGGSLNVFIDPNQDTTFTTPASGAAPWGVNPGTADILIATGTALDGGGTLNQPGTGQCGANGINCGSFGTTTSFILTAAGSTYFTSPVPFYNVSFQSGQFNSFTPTGTQQINGSMDVVFGQVPEPTTLALLGIALAGLGFSRRRS